MPTLPGGFPDDESLPMEERVRRYAEFLKQGQKPRGSGSLWGLLYGMGPDAPGPLEYQPRTNSLFGPRYAATPIDDPLAPLFNMQRNPVYNPRDPNAQGPDLTFERARYQVPPGVYVDRADPRAVTAGPTESLPTYTRDTMQSAFDLRDRLAAQRNAYLESLQAAHQAELVGPRTEFGEMFPRGIPEPELRMEFIQDPPQVRGRLAPGVPMQEADAESLMRYQAQVDHMRRTVEMEGGLSPSTGFLSRRGQGAQMSDAGLEQLGWEQQVLRGEIGQPPPRKFPWRTGMTGLAGGLGLAALANYLIPESAHAAARPINDWIESTGVPHLYDQTIGAGQALKHSQEAAILDWLGARGSEVTQGFDRLGAIGSEAVGRVMRAAGLVPAEPSEYMSVGGW